MKKDKLLDKAINSVANLRFNEFCNLLNKFGFTCVRSRGSHFQYYNDEFKRLLPVQETKEYAKEYQVKQFLGILEENNVI
ncbi:MAG: type II toxin-antitoxin system HicA family toxin [Candidatus Eremiobacteraeota bacterium]|nr:type II toxin-antitoxin system HicA family toxin [Candidatus Eremiobacteraeota bacterium]